VKAALRGKSDLTPRVHHAWDVAPLACLKSPSLLSPRANRASRPTANSPRFARVDRGSLFQVLIVLADLLLVRVGPVQLVLQSSTARCFFALIYVSALRLGVSRRESWSASCARPATGSEPCSWDRARTPVGEPDRARPRQHPEVGAGGGLVSLTPLSESGSPTIGTLREQLDPLLRENRRGADTPIRTSRRSEGRSSWWTAPRHGVRACAWRCRRWRSDGPGGFSVPGQTLRCSSSMPPVFDGVTGSHPLASTSAARGCCSYGICLVGDAATRSSVHSPRAARDLTRSMRPGNRGEPFPCSSSGHVLGRGALRQSELEKHNGWAGALHE